MDKWLSLKSGTDVRGVALPGVPGEDVNLTAEDCRTIAAAFVPWLAERDGKACIQTEDFHRHG